MVGCLLSAPGTLSQGPLIVSHEANILHKCGLNQIHDRSPYFDINTLRRLSPLLHAMIETLESNGPYFQSNLVEWNRCFENLEFGLEVSMNNAASVKCYK